MKDVSVGDRAWVKPDKESRLARLMEVTRVYFKRRHGGKNKMGEPDGELWVHLESECACPLCGNEEGLGLPARDIMVEPR
jgi:hypothetical protein